MVKRLRSEPAKSNTTPIAFSTSCSAATAPTVNYWFAKKSDLARGGFWRRVCHEVLTGSSRLGASASGRVWRQVSLGILTNAHRLRIKMIKYPSVSRCPKGQYFRLTFVGKFSPPKVEIISLYVAAFRFATRTSPRRRGECYQ